MLLPTKGSESVFTSMSLQIETTSGKVLEETYQKWVQYKEECARMIENEPLLQGKDKRHSVSIESSCKSEDVEYLSGFSLFAFLAGLFCNRTFDRYACWPDTPASSVVNISCPFYLPWYDKGKSRF